MISLIITSFNQKKRLYFSLQSALHQKLSEGNTYEIILADNNSTDGTIDLVKAHFPSVKITINNKNIDNAIKVAKGDRIIISSGDVIFASSFVDSYFDLIWENNIVFGPCERSDEKIDPYLTEIPILIKNQIVPIRKLNQHKDVVRILSENDWIYPDPCVDGGVYTYNKEFTRYHPTMNNVSLMREHIEALDELKIDNYYILYQKIIDDYKIKIVSNSKAYSIHLWSPYNITTPIES